MNRKGEHWDSSACGGHLTRRELHAMKQARVLRCGRMLLWPEPPNADFVLFYTHVYTHAGHARAEGYIGERTSESGRRRFSVQLLKLWVPHF